MKITRLRLNLAKGETTRKEIVDGEVTVLEGNEENTLMLLINDTKNKMDSYKIDISKEELMKLLDVSEGN